jgi:hypothetical protein
MRAAVRFALCFVLSISDLTVSYSSAHTNTRTHIIVRVHLTLGFIHEHTLYCLHRALTLSLPPFTSPNAHLTHLTQQLLTAKTNNNKTQNKRTVYTAVFYLSSVDSGAGGETLFHAEHDPSAVLTSVSPVAGDCVVFFHDTLHSSAPLVSGSKYVLRTELMFVRINTRCEVHCSEVQRCVVEYSVCSVVYVVWGGSVGVSFCDRVAYCSIV